MKTKENIWPDVGQNSKENDAEIIVGFSIVQRAYGANSESRQPS